MVSILIVGNGFDIAHNLKTSYNDFYHEVILKKNHEIDNLLEENNLVVESIRYEYNIINWVDVESVIQKRVDLLYEIEKYAKFEYCDANHESKLVGTYFIDEIKNTEEIELYKSMGLTFMHDISISGLNILYFEKRQLESLREKFENDFLEFVNAFKKYIQYVNLQEIRTFVNCGELDYDYVLSFNYTNTIERHYKDRGEKINNICHIHGVAEENIVLGIGNDFYNEMIPDSLSYYKFYQRTLKSTSNSYKHWNLENIDEIWIDIYGHSIDPTDGDVLKSFMDKENTVTTIYFYNEKVKREIIANLVAIFGKDKFIELTLENLEGIGNPIIRFANCEEFRIIETTGYPSKFDYK